MIRLGPAGSPATSTLGGIAAVRQLGLHAMEVAFTHGIRMSLPLAARIGAEAERHSIALSVHAPYYVNLASAEDAKIQASKKRILDSCERAQLMGAAKVVFHPGYYGSRSREETYGMVRNAVTEMQNTLRRNNWNVALAPEVMGRVSQFGTLAETLQLAADTGCAACIDICHIFARNCGSIDYKDIFGQIEGMEQPIHFHFSGVRYGAKGEIAHEVLNGSPAFEGFARELLRSGISATIISESPVTWKDSLKMKALLEELGHRFGDHI